MGASKTPGAIGGRLEADDVFREEGCSGTRAWENGPGDTYVWHAHDYHKVLFCLAGSITFHTSEGDVDLEAGDRLDIQPGTEHTATVGPSGVECVEAAR